jgi:hypothetical protein
MTISKTTSRDDFSLPVKQKLAARAGHVCSNSGCRAPTSGPQLLEEKTVNVGVAGHISSAAPGGPRYNPALTSAERANIRNGIWLCQNCAKLIDSDEHRYPVEILQQWKKLAEQAAHRQLGKAKSKAQPSSAEREIKRDLKLRDRMHKDFLKPWKEINEERSRKGPGAVQHPYDKFQHSEAIIHRIGDDTYPKTDESPGISSWFKVEIFDFYHGGIKVILQIENGVIENGCKSGHWAITEYNADFDREGFRQTGIWRLGLIPFRNIRHYDLCGDEYYNFPHLYCTFSVKGMPYEGFEYAVVGQGEYDWPLRSELQLPEEAVQVQQFDREI